MKRLIVCISLFFAISVKAEESIEFGFDTCLAFTEDISLLETGAFAEMDGICWIDSSMIEPDQIDINTWGIFPTSQTAWPVVAIENHGKIGYFADYKKQIFTDPNKGAKYDPPGIGDGVQVRAAAVVYVAVRGAVRCASNPACRAGAIAAGKAIWRYTKNAAIFAGGAIGGGFLWDYTKVKTDPEILKPENHKVKPNPAYNGGGSSGGSSGSGGFTTSVNTSDGGHVEIMEVPATPRDPIKVRITIRDSKGNIIGYMEYYL